VGLLAALMHLSTWQIQLASYMLTYACKHTSRISPTCAPLLCSRSSWSLVRSGGKQMERWCLHLERR
jgi:hypothetical protein